METRERWYMDHLLSQRSFYMKLVEHNKRVILRSRASASTIASCVEELARHKRNLAAAEKELSNYRRTRRRLIRTSVLHTRVTPDKIPIDILDAESETYLRKLLPWDAWDDNGVAWWRFSETKSLRGLIQRRGWSRSSIRVDYENDPIPLHRGGVLYWDSCGARFAFVVWSPQADHKREPRYARYMERKKAAP